MPENPTLTLFRAARLPIFTGGTAPLVARLDALRELRQQRLVFVCGRCAPDELKEALSDLENISHGCCPECFKKRL